MKILILAENYPHPSHPETQAFIHTRNIFYQSKGLDFSVISFRANEAYEIDGIKVFPPSIISAINSVDLCISHAPNIRNHIRFLKKHLRKIHKILFVFHGYEALYTKNRSIAPDRKLSRHFAKYLANILYDVIKIPLLKSSIKKLKDRLPVHSVIVSESLLDDMVKDMGCSEGFFRPFSIINNPINPIFNEKSYSYKGNEDIICIRSLDDKKYGADLFIELARKTPDRNFHLFGKGSAYKGVPMPENLTIIQQFFRAEDIVNLLDKYKAGILFTRWDSQGILACEFAAYGIPLITSDLPICHEMLKDYPNVAFVSNNLDFDLNTILKEIPQATEKNIRFTYEETAQQELNLIYDILKDSTCVV